MEDRYNQTHRSRLALQLFALSAVGVVMFFVPIPLGGRTTIPIDHMITGIRSRFPHVSAVYALLVVGLGGIYPFFKRSWNKDKTTSVFSILKVMGIVVSIMYFFKMGPNWLLEQDMAPFLFDKLVIPVGIIIPIGSVFLAFLVEYGFLEFIGVLMQPIMRPLWKTPGRSAVDALASFVGSYSIALLITNRVFKEGKYTAREAAIIATGFSTVSATFMVIVARTCGLMEMWNLYFWSTLAITFFVTAITIRIYPLRSKQSTYFIPDAREEIHVEGNRLRAALDEGIRTLVSAPGLKTAVWDNVRDGFRMAMGILPTIMSVGLLGLILAKYTPLFDVVGYLFWPIPRLFQLPEPALIGKATAIGISEMFLPALLVSEAALTTRFIAAVVSVSSILFFSASIPCILSTDIPITVTEIVMLWIERAVLSLVIVVLFTILIF